ncbi:hypothetical protein HSX37_16120|uniref:Uncharacterized protein n=1 Tax=Dendrosporobacter quercicolus TaxID=146817 RepID=A0A1G9ZQF0_9FIRM|nr:hypothetical protein [Dendrosporobacter quercicolus]NSL49562.1 hypothetical protein [Dendrosporobacter quercicolus DSM 1736]SDN22816.1 hypothetical protein SAMN04488502_11517 [Dendrosporobacter quercicolus]
MAGIVRNGQMYYPFIGFTIDNRSLAGRGRPLYPIRLRMLNAVPFAFWGGVLTWAVMETLGIAWGDNEIIRYAELQPGWIYEWDLTTKLFTVTTAEEEKTQYQAETLSDLGISWTILESNQFYIYPQGRKANEAFLVGTRLDAMRNGAVQQYDNMDIDFLRGVQHAVFDFLSIYDDRNFQTGAADMSQGQAHENYPEDILLARTNGINFGNYYPVHLYPGSSSFNGKRSEIMHAGYTRAMTFLMIRLFASRLLSPLNSKIVYEPWMLWEIFRWLFMRPNAGRRDRIFDLSPWWG